jgi:hypothetical protein
MSFSVLERSSANGMSASEWRLLSQPQAKHCLIEISRELNEGAILHIDLLKKFVLITIVQFVSEAFNCIRGSVW